MSDTTPLRALFVAAHPDDTELSCGGTIAKWIAAGHHIWYIVCTNGDKGTHDRALHPGRLAELREAEQRAAARLLGVEDVIFLRHPDGALDAGPQLRDEIATLIRYIRPEAIFTHDGWRHHQIHPDHRAAGMATCDAIVYARDHLFMPALSAIGLEPFAPCDLYLWGTDMPDYYEDITEFVERKIEAVMCHATQVGEAANWPERVRQWAADTGAKAGMTYAESFKHISFRPASHVRPSEAKDEE
jgi:LmbE family N-acetylglucosaminyl deacetylase